MIQLIFIKKWMVQGIDARIAKKESVVALELIGSQCMARRARMH